MGSFNTTCVVSKSPIVPNQKVRVFFLVMDSSSIHYDKREKDQFSNILMGSSCYPWDNFQVVGYPLLATYDDYNRYVFDDKEMEALTLKTINKIYKPNRIAEGKTTKDYNSCHDYLDVETLDDMKQLQDIEHSGALRVKTPHGESIIAKMAIHEEIYQELILKGKFNSLNDDQTEYIRFTYESYVSSLTDKYLNPKKTEPVLNAFEKEFIESIRKDFDEKIGKEDKNGKIITKDHADKVIARHIESFSEREVFSSVERDKWLSSTYPLKDIKKNDFKEKIIQAWTGLKLTADWFQSNNMEFLPVVTSGQCFDYDDTSNTLVKISNIVKGLAPDHWHEEELKLESEWSEKIVLPLSEIELKFSDWFLKTDDEFKEYLRVADELKATHVEFFVIGDKSTFDIFSTKHHLIPNKDNGLKIHFKY